MMDELREECEELAALDRDTADELREQEAARLFWLVNPFDAVASGYSLDDPKHPDAGRWE